MAGGFNRRFSPANSFKQQMWAAVKSAKPGVRFGNWTLVEPKTWKCNTRYDFIWEAQCDCGTRRRMHINAVRLGMGHCGCLGDKRVIISRS